MKIDTKVIEEVLRSVDRDANGVTDFEQYIEDFIDELKKHQKRSNKSRVLGRRLGENNSSRDNCSCNNCR